MFTEYPIRVGLVVEAARLLREKAQKDVAREATEFGYKMVQSTVAAVEGGHAQSMENLKAIAQVLKIDLWAILRIADALPEGCSESPATKIKSLGKAIAACEEHLAGAEQH